MTLIFQQNKDGEDTILFTVQRNNNCITIPRKGEIITHDGVNYFIYKLTWDFEKETVTYDI